MSNNQKIRILYLITDLGKGGAERYLTDLCTELLKREDIQFKIGTLYDNNQYVDSVKKFATENLFYKTFSLLGKNGNPAYKNLLQTFKPHIIHTHRFLGEFISSYYLDKNIKYLCHCHDAMEQFSNLSFHTIFSKKKILQFIEKQYLITHKYNRIQPFFIANSTHTEQYFKKSLSKKRNNNVKLIYYGFNFHAFYKNTINFIETTKPVRILNVGSFQEIKNQIFLIDIAKELRRRNIAFEMNLIGNGETFNKIQKAITENNLEKEIFLRGIIDTVEEWYKTSHIYLHSSWSESFGLVFLEAMAAGLPVIALDAKGNRDVIQEGKNGFMIYKQDPVIFANAIETLIQNTELYARMSEYAKKFSAQFDTSIKIQELIDFYHSITSS